MAYLQPVGFARAPAVKCMVNIGACLDIPTGFPELGRHGETIINGGLAFFTGVVGIGNSFKSTIVKYMVYTAMARIFAFSSGRQYDTEINAHKKRDETLSQNIPEFNGEDIIYTQRWVMTDKTMYTGNKYYEMQKEFLQDKAKNRNKLLVETPFLDYDKVSLIKIAQPTFDLMDSLTEFETEDVIDMQDENELGESGGNTIHMRQGLAKLRMLMEAPRLNASANNYLAMTAQIGKTNTMQTGAGGRDIPVTNLKTLKNGDKIKGVTDKFTFLTNNCWQASNSKPLIDDRTKGPLYPRDSDDNLRLDTDLMLVELRNLRGKSGPSGMPLNLLISQAEGVLSSLTEFNHIKDYDRYGFEGGPRDHTYALTLYQSCTIGRTTVRKKLTYDFKLKRAVNITSELAQINYLWHTLDRRLYCTPKELYDGIIAQGYDWDMILSQTRGWWKIDNDLPFRLNHVLEDESIEIHDLYFLSTIDLMKMRIGLYHPFWLDADKKTIKKEYLLKG